MKTFTYKLKLENVPDELQEIAVAVAASRVLQEAVRGTGIAVEISGGPAHIDVPVDRPRPTRQYLKPVGPNPALGTQTDASGHYGRTYGERRAP